MTQFAKTLGVAILGFAFAGTAASAERVNVNFGNPAQLVGYHTYTYQNIYTTNPIVEPRLAAAIDRELQLRGWHAQSNNGDVLVTAVLADNNDPSLYEVFYAGLYGLDWNSVGIGEPAEPVSVDHAPGGTLILDMYDRRTGQLLWRSTASDFLTRNTNVNGLRADDAVHAMFSQLPFEDAPGVYSQWIHGA